MAALTIRCDAFEPEQPIPVRYTFQGESINPGLRWENVPTETRELALLCEDPDAPTPKPVVHWLAYGIPPETSEVPEGLPHTGKVEAPVSLKQGKNSFFYNGYVGPNPGFWDQPHRYRFRLFALREPLNLPPGSGRGAFFSAIQGKLIQEAEVVGTYQKTVPQRIRAIAFWVGILGGTAGLMMASKRKKPVHLAMNRL